MIGRLLVLITVGLMLSGCVVAPMALIGPATSGFTTASIVQSGITTAGNYMVKKSTGKTISQHALDALNNDILQQSFAAKEKTIKINNLP